jgi:ATP-binding cassette, subfamily B, heavy metal transporter
MGEKEEQLREKIDFKRNFKVYFSFLKKSKKSLYLMLFLIIIVELSFIADKLILKTIIDESTLYGAGGVDRGKFELFLIISAVAFAGIILARAIAKWVQLHVLNRIEANSIKDMKNRFFSHIVGLSHNFHTSSKTGSLISRITRGGSAFERLTDVAVFDIIPLVVQVFAVVAALLLFDAISAFALLIIVTVFIGYSLYINNRLKVANALANDAEDDEKAVIGDVFTNMESIKYFGKEDFIKRKYLGFSEKTRVAALRHWDYFRQLAAVQIFIIGIGILALLIIPFRRFLDGQITIAEIVFIYTVYGNIVSPLYHFVSGIRGYYKSMVDFESLFKYEDITNDIVDQPDSGLLLVERGSIEFRNISFSYKSRKVIDSLNLKIPSGKKVAIVGSSGAGKTTLVKLLYRFYDVNDGEILIDGMNIKDFRQESLRSELSTVPQECVLFDDTIFNNVAFSRPDATKDDVMNAIRLAQLDKIIEKLPQKEETIVGERGVKLSGGERQRVSIARAILADKKILVLDEATSSLDSETESEIQKALAILMKRRTSIIIAHRLSTIMSADTIVVLDKGKIVQSGNHQELIEQEGLYKKLWNLQKGGYIK